MLKSVYTIIQPTSYDILTHQPSQPPLLHNLLLQLPSLLLHVADDIFRAGLCVLGHRLAVLGELVRFRLRLRLEGCFPAAVAREERGRRR